ncbi:hypothetical protein SLEP1_g57486 [Rubroshorea leprosula]|uniref:Uncharacterized protein n=2 Tax=Rubroshorea leprosula TaxID=152421 RepID=A0AAV5MLK0_9ROSI|nr:hypothetical protein SLEP1_g57486 [Rubroshorea leprosula]
MFNRFINSYCHLMAKDSYILKNAMADEKSVLLYQKKRNIATERKLKKEQEEAEKLAK